MKKFFKEHDLVKIVGLMILFVVVLTWIIPTGSFATGGKFTAASIERLGLMHLSYGLVYAVQNFSIQIAYVLFVGIFYGVLCKTDGYKRLVERFAKFGKGKEIPVVIAISFLIALLTSILNNSYVMLIFVPFFVHVLRSMKLNKMSAFATTFGAILVGVLGATYGTEGVTALITYMGYGGAKVTVTTELLVRFGILLLAYILFTFFNIIYLKKQLTKKNEEKEEFTLGEVKNKKAKSWPIILVFALLAIFAILGFVNWTGNFEIEVFDKFHEWIMGLQIGELEIFKALAGGPLTNMGYELATPFGEWYLFTFTVVIGIATILVGLFSRMKMNDFLTNAFEGIKKCIKPIGLIVFAYLLFVFIYWSPIMPTIINFIGKLSESFNPFVASLQAMVGSFFNSDLGYLGFSLSYYLGSFAENEGNIIFLIYTTIYGLISFVTPISMFLLLGLSYLEIPYKKWIKYIWKFIVAMLVVLLIIFALLAYL